METKASNEQWIVRYLLGDLPEEEQAQLEDRAFADPEYFQAVEDAENDLIDDYVRGALNRTEQQQFERHFLASAERRKKVAFARALARASDASMAVAPAPRAVPAHWRDSLAAFMRGLNPALSISVAAALLLAVGAGWLFTVTRGLRAQVAQLQTEQQVERQAEQRVQQQQEELRRQADDARARNADLETQLERERARNAELAAGIDRNQPSGGASFLASLFLPPGIARGSEQRPALTLTPAMRTVRLRVGLERQDDFKSYGVEIRTPQGRLIQKQDRLQPLSSRAGQVLSLTIPAAALSGGQYELTLKGVSDAQQAEDLRYYYFDVRRQE